MKYGLQLSLNKVKKIEDSPRTSLIKMEFHISRKSRDKYDFSDNIFTSSGNVMLPNFPAARQFAKKLNAKKDLVSQPEARVRSGHINAMGLIDEILHYVCFLYREENGTSLMEEALDFVKASIGPEKVTGALKEFTHQFPNLDIYKGKDTVENYLQNKSANLSNESIALEELLMLWLANRNLAFGPFNELFNQDSLVQTTVYIEIIEWLHKFFDTQKPFGPDNQNLIAMLRSPAIEEPDSLFRQLIYIKERWGMLLGKFLLRLFSGLDFIKEEDKYFLKTDFHKGGPSDSLSYGDLDLEEERFSMDKDWMPKVVIIAKSTLVWLDQLSKKYQKNIHRLDQIPDEELDALADKGFNGLWLIGLWERSQASKTIKRICGNPEAEASAYSLHDYDIAQELGGWEALETLRGRAWHRGIRLGSDMVPNHTGLDSRWISEHPDWYLQIDHPPFDSYTFNGPNLSRDPGIGIYLEDHYYSQNDAAVVFKHVNFSDGKTRYIYHGNDGTHMPWNDTAQLDYLHPQMRESIIQTILHVARNFPIIRFDAAMTLAKKHIQRLWFPQPGAGGDIASRSQFGMTRADFDKALPVEFWREVVDRVAQEVPDTLLLAEAFWMMEGYFVRTLGMHRVYNSAFMHMFKNEDNQKYRYTIKNTLEFDPQILKRFVNFMNNPDEETASEQFGDGDKYMGVCTMMVTMPGTPMFGHGQIEGFREKYGMEYRKAYWEETENQHLIDRHYHEIFPLMKKRYIFAEVEHFRLYDFWVSQGQVNENVFAFSNQAGHEKAIVIYNNSYHQTSGWINKSSGFLRKYGEDKNLSQETLAQTFSITPNPNQYVILREHNSNLWYIRPTEDLVSSGLFVDLPGYGKQVFLDISVITDNDYNHYKSLCKKLNGGGTPNIDEALKETILVNLYRAFNYIFSAEKINDLIALIENPAKYRKELLELIQPGIKWFYQEAQNHRASMGQIDDRTDYVIAHLKRVPDFFILEDSLKAVKSNTLKKALKFLEIDTLPQKMPVLISWCILGELGCIISGEDSGTISRGLIDDWFLDRKISRFFGELGLSQPSELALLVKTMVLQKNWLSTTEEENASVKVLQNLLSDQDCQAVFGINRYDNTLWFNKEKFSQGIQWFFTGALCRIMYENSDKKKLQQKIIQHYEIIEPWLKNLEKSEYKVEKLLKLVKGEK